MLNYFYKKVQHFEKESIIYYFHYTCKVKIFWWVKNIFSVSFCYNGWFTHHHGPLPINFSSVVCNGYIIRGDKFRFLSISSVSFWKSGNENLIQFIGSSDSKNYWIDLISFVFLTFLCNFVPVISFSSNFKINYRQYTTNFDQFFR